MEVRTTPTDTMMEERNGQQYIAGYASVFYDPKDSGTEYHLGGNLYERIDPQAFHQILAERSNVEARFNHSEDYILGDVASNTLQLQTDGKGLRYTVPFDAQDNDHVKVRSKINKGLCKGSSFAFRAGKTEFATDGDKHICWVRTVAELRDVGPVSKPAYTSATAQLRSKELEDNYKDWLQQEKLREETQKRLEKFTK
jgi:HK97 family phage prohead protease